MSADDLAKILDELGRRLGPAGSHVFELAVRQQIIEGLIALGAAVVVAVFTAAAVRLYRRGNNDHLEWVLAGIGVAITGIFVAGAIAELLNPEYAAIAALLKAIKP